jgi:hypothetical protein
MSLALTVYGTDTPLPTATALAATPAATTPGATPTQLPTSGVASAECSEYTYPEYSPEPPVFPIISETETTRTIGGGTFGDVTIPKTLSEFSLGMSYPWMFS